MRQHKKGQKRKIRLCQPNITSQPNTNTTISAWNPRKLLKKEKKQITRNSLASRSIRDGIREKKNTQEKDQIEQKGDQAMDKKEEKKKKNKQMDQEDGTKKMKLTKETKLPGKYEPTTHPSLPFCWKFQHKSFTVCLHPKS